MPTSVPMMPAAGALHGDDLLYLIQGMNLDRDKKVTLETVREFCTAKAMTFFDVFTAQNVIDLEIGGTQNVLVFINGNSEELGTLILHGEVPVGCSVVVMNASPSNVTVNFADSTAQGFSSALANGDWEFAVMRSGPVWWRIVLQSKNAAELALQHGLYDLGQNVSTAIGQLQQTFGQTLAQETGRAEGAEQTLQNAIDAETSRATTAEADIQSQIRVGDARKFPIRFVVTMNAVDADGPNHVVTPLLHNSPIPASATEVLMYNGESHGIVSSPRLKVWRETSSDKWLYPSNASAVLTGGECGMQALSSSATGYNGGTGTSKVNVVTWSPNLGDIIIASGRSDGAGYFELGLLLPPRIAEDVPNGTMEEFFFRVRTEGRSVVATGGNFTLRCFVMDPTLYGDHGWQVELDDTTTSALRDTITIRARRVYSNGGINYTPTLKVDYWSEGLL